MEHGLPKSKNWAANYPRFSPDERDACRSKIGNWVLLKPGANGAPNDKPFADKLPVRSRSPVKTTGIVVSFAEKGEWTPAAIDNRPVWLSDLALERWPMFSGKVKAKGRGRGRRR